MYERYGWVFCRECVWKIYGCEINNMKVKCSKSCCWSCFLCYDIDCVAF